VVYLAGVRVLIVIPALDEAGSLPSLLEELRAAAPECEPCVVDDGSSDATAAVARRLGARVLRCPVNLGIGGAVQTGYLWARDHGHDVAVQLDGDGQHDPGDLRALLAPLAAGSADLVVGSRFLAPGGYRSTWLRRAGSRYLCGLLRARCGARVTDPTSGFRAAGRRALELMAAHYPSDYPEPEAIARVTRAGLRVAEVPVRMRPRASGRSSIGLARTLYYALKVTLALLLLPRARPVACAPELEGPP
jgi:glycosyltransferase involved in cell wall biosynthesis